MSFFYDLNKKLDSIRQQPEVTHKQLNERDEGKPGKNFAKIAKDAGERYGSKAAGERVAGAVRNKLKAQGKLEEEGMSRAAKGYEKYGKQGMEALAKAGREGKALDPIRKKYNKYDDKKDQLDELSPATVNKVHQARQQQAATAEKGYLDLAQQRQQDAMAAAKAANPAISNNELSKIRPQIQPKDQATVDAYNATQKKLRANTMLGIKTGYRSYDKSGDPTGMQNQNRYKAGMEEGVMDTVKKVGKKVASGVNKLVGHGSDEEMIRDLQHKSGAPVTGKKPTFADKIANAKKEVDEMLGDVAAEAIKTALSPKQKKLDKNHNGKLDAQDFAMLRAGAKKNQSDEMDEGNAFDYKSPRADAPKVGSVERGHKHDIKHTATGRVVTRRTDDQGHSVGADDESDSDGAPRGRGRPKGTKNVSSKAKVFQRKSKLMTKEGDQDPADQGEYDQEGDMAKDDIKTIVRHAQALHKILGDDDNLPEWVQSKLAKIEGMMISIDEYMQNEKSNDGEEQELDEKAVSKQQQKFMGMAHAMQKGEKIKGASKELKKVAKTMKPKDVEDFAATKHKGLPDKVKPKKKKEEEVEESSTTAGSVAPSTATTGSKGGVFGKGIYDSMNRELEKMIAESMSVNMSDSTEGGKSLTITATDEDALKLGMLLKNAGLGGSGDMHDHGAEPCETCGSMDCGCGDVQEAVDENAPDWPTNTETSDDALQYAGGLNKPKTDVAGDGQTTIPNTAVHTQDEDVLRRMMEMAGIRQADLEPWKETMKEETVEEAAKPDFLDLDKDGDKEESMKDAAKDKEEDIEESIQRMREMAGIKEAKKPDYLDFDKDGDKKEPMTKALKDKEEKKVEESIFALTNQWKAYRG